MPITTNLIEFASRANQDIDKFERSFTAWFDAEMDVVSSGHKENAHKVFLVIALGVAATMNVDTLSLLNKLSMQPTLRSALVV